MVAFPAQATADVEPHPTEVDLQLIPRLPIDNTNRRGPPAVTTAHLQHDALHRPQRCHYPHAARAAVRPLGMSREARMPRFTSAGMPDRPLLGSGRRCFR